MKLNFLVRFRYLLLALTVVAAAAAGLAIGYVNINADMTRYLPDDSPMRRGLEVMQQEFSEFNTQAGEADVRLMFRAVSDSTQDSIRHVLTGTANVVSVSLNHHDDYVLYSVRAAADTDLPALADDFRDSFPDAVEICSRQDSASADSMMLVIVVIVILVILLAMCRSWLEPALFILSTGVAVVINLGSNVFLPSVSATTFSIAAVLQFVLSMDYSLILSNRFRQEKAFYLRPVVAMNSALVKSARSIVSSAATTIVGLLMLVFMNLKIGADLGIVLSKGVLCSLLCNYTVLPALLVTCSRAIDRSHKPTPHFPTAALSRFVVRARIPLGLIFVALLIGSYVYRNNTPIKFSSNSVNEIDRVFPPKNISVITYNNADEAALPALADSLMQDSLVNMVVSYPSLLQRQYPCSRMLTAIDEMTAMARNMIEKEEALPMLTEDMLRLVYHAHAVSSADTIRYSFPELFTFISREARDTGSLIASHIDPEMLRQLDMLDLLLAPQPEPQVVHHHKPVHTARPESVAVKTDTVVKTDTARADTVQAAKPARPTNKFADRDLITRELAYADMAAFLGMDESQAKMIYKMAKHAGGTMKPVDFVHYVADKLFKQAFVSTFVKKSEKEGLYKVRDTMDAAMAAPVPVAAKTDVAVAKASPVDTVADTVAVPRVVAQRLEEAARPAEAQPQLSFSAMNELTELLDSTNRFSARELSTRLGHYGINIGRGMIDLLYLYYGAHRDFDDSSTLSVEQMVCFISDSVIADPRFDAFISDSVRADFSRMRTSMLSGLNMMRGPHYSMAIVITDYPDESPATYNFIDHMDDLAARALHGPHYIIGQSNMFNEMRHGFGREIMVVTILTVLSIFLIVAISFRSVLIPLILVSIIMTAVYLNVAFSGIGGNAILYLAYLIVQSILMGATIDYGILFTNSYREKRATMGIPESVQGAYLHSINTITTSGLIMIVAPVIISLSISDPLVGPILKSISIGALASVVLIVFVLPALLVLVDRAIVRKQKK